MPKSDRQWADLPGWPGHQISPLGLIRNMRRGRWCRARKGFRTKIGYRVITLTNDGVRKSVKIHRLLMIAFRPIDAPHLMQVNHKNGIKKDNRLENLEWCTALENTRHACSVLGRRAPRGEDHSMSKINGEMVCDIRRRADGGESHRTIRESYPMITRQTIGKISRRERWRHIPEATSPSGACP